MAQAYENALATGQVVVRRWWFNTNSSKNQVTVQFAQQVERPASSAADAASQLISLEQGTEGISNTTTVTALRSIDATRAQAFFGSTEGNAMQGGVVHMANDLYKSLGATADVDLAIQITENFEKNPYSKTQTPKSNPSTGEVVTALNPATGTHMPVYRHTDLMLSKICSNKFIASESQEAATAPGRPAILAGELAS
jgi:hypothetical protein